MRRPAAFDRTASDSGPGRRLPSLSIYDLAALLLAVSALLGWINHRSSPLPDTMGLLLMGLVASLALAPSMPDDPAEPELLAATYAVVLFSVVVQGGTPGWVARRTLPGT